MKHWLAGLITAFILSGCNTFAEKDKIRADNLRQMTPCPSERPLSCSSEVEPVCGIFTDGSSMNYASACLACTRRVVKGHLPGYCR